MKFFPLLASLGEARITLNMETLTDFSTAFHISAMNLQVGPVEKVSLSGDVQATLDLFNGKFSMIDSGESHSTIDCVTNRFAKHSPMCNNPLLKTVAGMPKTGGGQVFLDASTGKFGVKGHSGGGANGADFQVSFCAVVDIPVKSYPPPSTLKSKFNAAKLKQMEDSLNKKPHTEQEIDGTQYAVFSSNPGYAKANGYPYQESIVRIKEDGGAPLEAEMHQYAPTHQPYSDGWEGGKETYSVASSAHMIFSEWTSPASALPAFSGCPGGTTTDLLAHPEAKRSLASLNAVVQMLRQHDDLGWLPEDPAAFFMEQVEQQRGEHEDEPDDLDVDSKDMTQWTPVVTSCLAGVLGGGVVLALFNLAKKKQREMPLLSDA